jgi:hypothetical protein
MASKGKSKGATLVIGSPAGETREAMVARVMLGPNARHGILGSTFASYALTNGDDPPPLMECMTHMGAIGDQAVAGDLAFASRMLAAQAVTLDTMFTELARRAALNMSEYINAAERYGRLALKAQANSRATLEALAKLHQPREQTVRHVHVNQGGQAIVAEQFHHHTGGGQNVESAEQSHATGGAGASPALPGADAIGDIMPSPGGIRPAAMSDARRD